MRLCTSSSLRAGLAAGTPPEALRKRCERSLQIYNTYTADNVGNLRGHNGRVRSVFWSPDDSRLTTAGMDGAIYEWRLRDFKRERETVHKGCSYTSIAVSPDGRFTCAPADGLPCLDLPPPQQQPPQVAVPCCSVSYSGMQLPQSRPTLLLIATARTCVRAQDSARSALAS